MNSNVEKLIHSLSKEEVRFFKIFTKRTESKNRKDVTLFDYIRKKKTDINSKVVIDKLQTTPANYYTIKNRLYNQINNSLVWQHIWKDNQSLSFSYILLARVCKNKGELELAFNYLKKSENEALESELYELLSIVYTEIIQLSHELISIDVDKYIELKRKNIQIISEIDEMDLLLAKVMYDIKTKQNFSNSEVSLIKLMKKKYDNISKDKNLTRSPRFRIRLFKMYSRLKLQQRDYDSLEVFLVKNYNEFEKNKLFNRSNHNDKLTILTYLTNCLFKNNKHKKSLEYAEQLLISMNEYDGFLYDKYLFYYYNSYVANYSKIDSEKALEYINKAAENNVIKQMPSYIVFIYLNRALIYYYQNNFSVAKKNISRLIQQEDFLLLDKSFQLKILITELMIRILISKNNLIDKISNIYNNYKSILLEKNNARDKKLMDLISKRINNENIELDKLEFLSIMSETESEDVDIISYNDWVKKYL